MNEREAVVQCEGISKRYASVTALEGVDLQVRMGEIFALIGPNGSGKSTLIKIATGILAPDAGRVTVLGMDPLRQRRKLAGRMGVLLENAATYPHMTATQYLAYFCKLFFPKESKSKRQDRIDSCLRIAGLGKAAKMQTRGYSHGMKKRLLLARALINDPELLILDEPLAGLDAVAARKFKDTLREVNRQGRTILFSTHILSDAEQICTSVGILYRGRMLVQSSLRDLRRMFPSVGFRITVRHVSDELVRAFKSMRFVDEVTVESDETLIVKTKALGTDAARRLIEQNSPPSVLSVSAVPATLDDILVELVDRSWEVS